MAAVLGSEKTPWKMAEGCSAEDPPGKAGGAVPGWRVLILLFSFFSVSKPES